MRASEDDESELPEPQPTKHIKDTEVNTKFFITIFSVGAGNALSLGSPI